MKMKDSKYYNQVQLLLRCLPEVNKEVCFALKGGTAINLFIKDLPRLSVDIDLAFMPLDPWIEAIELVESSLVRISENISQTIKGANVHQSRNSNTGKIAKLIVSQSNAQIKIEPNPVIRGSVYPCTELTLTKSAIELFEMEVSTNTLSLADIYGGKLVAALDRQHPRDLFDTKLLFETDGITNEIRKAFIVYLASHARPIHEVIKPTILDKQNEFEQEFIGMTQISFSYDDFVTTRSTLINTISKEMTDDEKTFLISIQDGNPGWNLLGIPNLDQLPALKWKIQNVQKMDNLKRKKATADLKTKLNL